MPKGVYDRSKKKSAAPHVAEVAKAPKAQKAAKVLKGQLALPAIEKVAQDVPAGSPGFTSYNPAPHDLYTHLTTLTQARLTVNSQQAAHNETLLSSIDTELVATIKALTVWREARYPSVEKAKIEVQKPVVAEEKPTPAKEIPAPVFTQPAPVAAAPAPITAVPPLPFTPQAVQEVMKHQA